LKSLQFQKKAKRVSCVDDGSCSFGNNNNNNNNNGNNDSDAAEQEHWRKAVQRYIHHR
jgi:hypothetical protein